MTTAGASVAEVFGKCVFMKNLLLLVFLLSCIAAGLCWPGSDDRNLFVKVGGESDLLQQSSGNYDRHGVKQSSAEAHTESLISSAFKEGLGDNVSEGKADQVKIHTQFESSPTTIALQSATHSAYRRDLQESTSYATETEAGDETQEHESDLEENLFHSSSLFVMNYQDMLTNLKVYIYPPSNDEKYDFRYPSRDVHEKVNDIRKTDELFFHTLAASRFVTAEPEEANLFFIPMSMSALWADLSEDSKRVASFMRGYVQKLREQYPYWNRTLGTDHVFISCHDFKVDSSRNVLELKKNAIQIACSPLAADGTQEFFPHKDITMPLFEGEAAKSSVCKLSRENNSNRKHAVYYGGPVEENSTLASVYESWKNPSGFFLDSVIPEQSNHLRMLSISKFCLSLGASDRANVVNSIRCGCIPVVFSASNFYDLPFQDILNWHKFSVILDSKDIGKLEKILTAIPKSQLKNMQGFVLEAAKHMEWHPKSNPYNSFHLVMYELWIRSHTIRYKPRSAR
ncbi:hypothetical protein O6H91_09G064500 [Diphasiastrum complanatum]|uniref:Uncharacterized protein n=1 Tax=Diphasiastrum complanatum TaxID=34168 RepID=A0ACC2CPW6_DIPCM|nr:hypothetical protein O6H91_09G064500 [Diphasiastrum complanatum]